MEREEFNRVEQLSFIFLMFVMGVYWYRPLWYVLIVWYVIWFIVGALMYFMKETPMFVAAVEEHSIQEQRTNGTTHMCVMSRFAVCVSEKDRRRLLRTGIKIPAPKEYRIPIPTNMNIVPGSEITAEVNRLGEGRIIAPLPQWLEEMANQHSAED